ncbi:hypothetical protein SORBI_3004G154100 [Sorghum bicolor]|uniref:Uncharacterized protein n=1 Tax=Sorghum bicolor TaxID=4558 RepID=A0A1Z5RN23_SORBI|nr:hypothetical protein SORBI_3004G154100 [Sorghum bicolor]
MTVGSTPGWYDMPWFFDEYSEDVNLWICHALHCNARSIMVMGQDNRLELDPALNMGNIQWCPKFNNLTTLTISQWCLHPDFYSLIVVLQNSRSLENQTLKLRGVGHTHQRFTGELEERSFSCEHLDSIDIVCWEVQEHDPVLDNLVELLTENGIEHDEIDISISL